MHAVTNTRKLFRFSLGTHKNQKKKKEKKNQKGIQKKQKKKIQKKRAKKELVFSSLGQNVRLLSLPYS